jgi:hypothetical protein
MAHLRLLDDRPYSFRSAGLEQLCRTRAHLPHPYRSEVANI